MTRAEIVKDLRARGWAGAISRQTAIDRGYEPSGPDYEWATLEPAVDERKPAKPIVAAPKAEKVEPAK